MASPEGDFAWVPLFRVLDEVQAHIIAARLDDRDIPMLIQGEAVNRAIPMAFGLIAEQIIYVPDEYYDRALAVLRDLGMIDEEDEETDDF